MATQEIICEKVLYIPSMGVESIINGEITPKDGFQIHALPVQFAKITEKTESPAAGPVNNQQLEIITTNLIAADLHKLENNHCIFELTTDQGRKLHFGSLVYPARFTSRENQLKSVRMIFNRQVFNESIL